MTKAWIFGISTLGALLGVILNCSGTTGNENAARRDAIWAVSENCRACLQDSCGATGGNPDPYPACNADPTCSDRFADFANCYHSSRALAPCRSTIDALNESSTAGRELLQNCFLLDCFDEFCEVSGD